MIAETMRPATAETAGGTHADGALDFVVGDNVEVLWPDDGLWYAARVTAGDCSDNT